MRLHLASLAGVLGLVLLAGPCPAGPQAAPSPLRLLPADTNFFIQVREPHKTADVLTKLEAVAKAQRLAVVKNQLDTTNVRRARQLLAHVEKRMGDQWPALLEKLASGGIALGGNYGDKAPALIVIQGTDAPMMRKFLTLGIELIEQELARQELNIKFTKESRQGLDVLRANTLAVLRAQEVFQENLQGVRQPAGVGDRLGHRAEAEDGVLAVADPKHALTAKVFGHVRSSLSRLRCRSPVADHEGIVARERASGNAAHGAKARGTR